MILGRKTYSPLSYLINCKCEYILNELNASGWWYSRVVFYLAGILASVRVSMSRPYGDHSHSQLRGHWTGSAREPGHRVTGAHMCSGEGPHQTQRVTGAHGEDGWCRHIINGFLYQLSSYSCPMLCIKIINSVWEMIQLDHIMGFHLASEHNQNQIIKILMQKSNLILKFVLNRRCPLLMGDKNWRTRYFSF